MNLIIYTAAVERIIISTIIFTAHLRKHTARRRQPCCLVQLAQTGLCEWFKRVDGPLN